MIDISDSVPTGSRPRRGRWAPTYALLIKYGKVYLYLHRVPAPEDLKYSMLFKAFSFYNSRPIQGLLQVDYSTPYNPTGTWEKKNHTDLKHSCMTFINNKRSKAVLLPA